MQANVGEVLAWRNMFWALTEAMVRDPRPWKGDYLLPEHGAGQRVSDSRDDGVHEDQVHHRADGRVGLDLSELARERLREPGDPSVHRSVHARIERLHGRRPRQADEAVVGLRSGPNSAAGTSSTRSTTAAARRRSGATRLFGAMANGNADKLKGFAEQCMAEYDLNGWTRAGSDRSRRAQLPPQIRRAGARLT